uniref:Methyltransferase FkbM domain-containing protein n=1 Tax=Ditylum brightwellii TaxID=49249 RepID=A0A7S4VCK7_9STRA
MARAATQQNLRIKNAFNRRSNQSPNVPAAALGVALVLFTLFVMSIVGISLWAIDTADVALESSGASSVRRRTPDVRVIGLDDFYEAIAMDIQQTLECNALLDKILPKEPKDVTAEGEEDGGGGFIDRYDDFAFFELEGVTGGKGSGTHLMCLAAGTPGLLNVEHSFQCDVLSPSARTAVLDIWSLIRPQVSLDLIQTTLDLIREFEVDFVDDVKINVWHHDYDTGFRWVHERIIQPGYQDYLRTLPLADDTETKLFVDAGSHHGLVSLAVKLLYPTLPVIAIEPAPPNFIMQNLNFICNLPPNDPSAPSNMQTQPHSSMAGIAHKEMMAKFNWDPHETGATRSWSPSDIYTADNAEISVRLRPLRSVVTEAMPEDMSLSTNPITVLKLGCEGCEYNVVPAWSEEQFQSIPYIMGDLHWGYIPYTKRPSSKRAADTNGRLCQHEAFAEHAIECCDYLDLGLKFVGSEDVIPMTVKDIMEPNLCDNFTEWAKVNHLYDIKDDYGWFELSSMAIP